jgi:predicted phosphodiesterase
MIYICGDSHGEFVALQRAAKHFSPDDIAIHVGDFGFYPSRITLWEEYFPDGFPCPLYVIDGNHEDFNYLDTFPKDSITEIHKNLFYVPRGTVMEIEGKLFAFLGGGESIDKAWRTENVSWWSQERITPEDIKRLYNNVGDRQVDYLITHVCSDTFRDVYFGKLNLNDWNLPHGWEDVSMQRMEAVTRYLKPKMHIFGHMHRRIITENERCLDIDEVDELPAIWSDS